MGDDDLRRSAEKFNDIFIERSVAVRVCHAVEVSS